MTQKTVKTLLIVSAALFAFAFLLSVLAIFAQNLIKEMYYGDYFLDVRTVPYQAIVSCFVHLLLAAAVLVFFFMGIPRSGMIAITVAAASLFVLFNTVISPLIGMRINASISRYGAEASAAYSVVSAGTNLLTAPFAFSATILLFIALGGACGKDFTRN